MSSRGTTCSRLSRRQIMRQVIGVVTLLGAAGSVLASPADDQYTVAAGHYARQHWKLAAEEFVVFVEKYPEHPRATQSVFFLAEALLQSGVPERAEARFREYLERDPAGRYAGPALFRAGESAYILGKAAAAETDLKSFLANHADDKLNAYALPYLGDLSMGVGEFEAAAGFFRDGLKRFPDGPLADDCRFGLARALERLGQRDEAKELYKEVAAKRDGPLAGDAQYRLGLLQFLGKRYEESLGTLTAFEDEFAEHPKKPKARLARGWVLMKLNRPDEAHEWFERIADDDEVGVEARYWMGLAERENRRWQLAAETLLAAAEIDPKHPLLAAIRFYAGDSLVQAGDAAGAAGQFDQVVAMGEDGNEWFDDAVCGKIRLALQAGNHEVVEREASRFRDRFPKSPLGNQVSRMLARALVEQRKYAAAAEVLEPMVTAQPDGPEVLEDRYLLAASKEGMRRFDEAISVLAPVLEQAEGRLKSDAQLVAGSSLLALRRYVEATEPLEAFLAAAPEGDAAVRARGALAIAYARTGKLDESKTLFSGLIEGQPGHALLPPVAEQLAEAAYVTGDADWSAALFHWLSRHGGTDEYRQKGLSGAAWSHFRKDDFAEAAALFGQLLETDPPAAMAAEALLARGRILEEQGQLDPALAMYDQVIEKHAELKEYPLALLAAARLRRKLDQHRQSADLYKRLADEFPELPDRDAVLYEWSWVLFDQDEAAASNALLAQMRKEYPQSRHWADATYRLAVRGFHAKDYAGAAALCEEILDSGTEDGVREHALYLLARIAAVEAEQNGEWQLVRDHFDRLLEEFPKTPMRLVAEFWKAEALYRQQRYQESLADFDRLAEQTQGQTGQWLAMIPLRRAQLLTHLGKWNEALAVATKIAEEFPDFQQQYEADYVVGRCLAALADFDGAREAYQRVIHSDHGAKTETAAMAQWLIGESYFHQKRYDVAMREYLRVARLYAYPQWQAAALLQGARCRELLGEPREAARLYTEVIEEYGDTPFAEKARERLKGPAAGRNDAPPVSAVGN